MSVCVCVFIYLFGLLRFEILKATDYFAFNSFTVCEQTLGNDMDVSRLEEVIAPGDDEVCNDIHDQIEYTKELLEESKHLTDNGNLVEKLRSQNAKLESLKETLVKKEKQLEELQEILKMKKAEAAHRQNQRSSNYDG